MSEKVVAEMIGQIDAMRTDPTWRMIASGEDKDHYYTMELTAKITSLEHTLQRMDPALARIDERLNHVATKEDLAKIESSLGRKVDALEAKLATDLARLPTKGGLWGMIAAVLGIGVAIAGLTFVIAEYASRM